MKLIDALKLKGKKVEIPDCSRTDLPQFFKDMGYKIGVEVGVYKGAFTRLFAETGMTIYGVDPWLAYEDYDMKGHHDGFQRRQDFLYERTKEMLAPYKNCTLIRKTSMDAVKDFQDESLDFVYIDANHQFRYIAEDLCEWEKKVRVGGIVSGHDYGSSLRPPKDPFVIHVKYVVDAFTGAKNIKDWYILGSQDAKPGERRDNWRSWMWVKTADPSKNLDMS